MLFRSAFTTRLWEEPNVPACTPAAGTECRVGFIPNQTGCVTSNKNGSGTIGDPEMVGALTIQIVDDKISNDDVELNVENEPTMGWRVKHNTPSQLKMIAMYTLFWHASGAGCYGDPGYVANPPPVAEASAGITPPYSGDPTTGLNNGGNPGGATAQSVQMINFITGSKTTFDTTVNASGPKTTTISSTVPPGGAGGSDPAPGGGAVDRGPLVLDSRLYTGRLSWREFLRP